MIDIRLGCASICKRVGGHTHWGIFFWRRGISFRFGQFVSILTEAIFSFNFWKAASTSLMFRAPPYCISCIINVEGAMARNRQTWGHWRERTGDGRGTWEPPFVEEPHGRVAQPWSYEIGDNVPWERLGIRVSRPVFYKARMTEIQLLLNLRRDVEISQWLVVNMRVTASSLWVTCTRWSCALIEIAEWFDDLHYLLCSEVSRYLNEIHNGRRRWDAEENDWSIEMPDNWGYFCVRGREICTSDRLIRFQTKRIEENMFADLKWIALSYFWVQEEIFHWCELYTPTHTHIMFWFVKGLCTDCDCIG